MHFAVHGYLDDRFPLNSGLALSMRAEALPTDHDGLLQAWEIFDALRLDCELVVLSACATGLGQERGGEGLVGLVHAFHYAGAQSVLASLWNVDDQATADLMIGFYRHVRAGLAKDGALRAAQLELIAGHSEAAGVKSPRLAAPYYWAAFSLLGAP